jgi:hypothetical protein
MRTGIHYDFYEQRRNGEDGPYYVTVDTFSVTAVDDDGHVWVLDGSHTTNEAEANEALAALDHDPISQPDRWLVCDPVYGSNAWDSEAEYNLACFEADCYDEPRPHW